MTEATWGDGAMNSDIDWRMSAALADVPRGDSDVAEVASLERAVRDWLGLDAAHKAAATLTTEHPLRVGGATGTTFTGAAIAALAEQLPRADPAEG
ncbi:MULTISPECIES: hypothetical protein [unclassified Sphingomonas]|uniref:hypothetical protein n=1 Tax=unclassified Sphingomonas TaxID=196159 RepID=UPI001F5A3BCD|nr:MULTISPECIES: hypothetical protein [unclassified Sphingomonas]